MTKELRDDRRTWTKADWQRAANIAERQLEEAQEWQGMVSQLCDAVDVPSERLHDWACGLRDENKKLLRACKAVCERIHDPTAEQMCREAVAAVTQHQIHKGR